MSDMRSLINKMNESLDEASKTRIKKAVEFLESHGVYVKPIPAGSTIYSVNEDGDVDFYDNWDDVVEVSIYAGEDDEELTEDYASDQIDPIIQSAENSDFRAKIQISHEGTKTKHMDISLKELKLIRQILSDE